MKITMNSTRNLLKLIDSLAKYAGAKKCIAALLACCLSILAPITARAAQLTLVPDWGATGVPAINMYIYVPDNVVDNPPILTLLHYWGGTAESVFGQANAGGIVAAADRYGFIILVPQRQIIAPSTDTGCWDWNSTQALTRNGGGETHAIAQMVEYTIATYGANPDRVYVTGDSCGGMMTQAMLAVYPDIFKAGSAFCGVPVGGQWQQQFNRTAQQWGDLVRNIYPNYTGPRPRIQLWHGTADELVFYYNHTESISQNTNLQGVSSTPTKTTTITMNSKTWTRQSWNNAQGNTVVDAWSETGGTHDIGSLFNARYVIPFLGLDRFGTTDNGITIPRGRPKLNAARTTFVADNGQMLRGPYTSTEWSGATSYEQIEKVKTLGFNAVHLYGECYDINYPAAGSTAPGYAASRIDSIVASTRDLGLYLIITIGNGANNGNHNKQYVVDFWKFYSQRYANETHVMFEVQNEPVAWGPPYSSASATPPGALDMEIAAYNAIRTYAPDTPILLFSYAVLGGTGGANAALTDIRAFNQTVFGNQNAAWDNYKIAVGFHGYAGSSDFEIAAANIIAAGYPCFQTEFHGGTWGAGYGLDVEGVAALERLKTSWLAFVYIPPSGVSDDVTRPDAYIEPMIQSGLSWKPDFGSFPQQRSPYGNNGYPWTTPGYTNNTLSSALRVQAENFDNGGKGVAYYNANTSNQGGQYRTDATVGIETTTDTGGGYNVGWIAAGDWLEYTVRVKTAGTYNIGLRIAGTGNGKVQIFSKDSDLTGEWTLPNTGGWQTWQTVTKTVFLVPDQQRIRIKVLAEGFNLNWFELTPVATGNIPDGTYKLLNASTTKALDLDSSNNVITADNTGLSAQQWKFRHIGGGQYQVSSVSKSNSWYCWSGPLRLKTWGWGAGGDDCYIFKSTGNGYYYFYSAGSGRPFAPASGTDAPKLSTDTWKGLTSQQWAIVSPASPVFPTGLTALAVTTTQTSLTWNAVSGVTGYNVKRSTSSGGPYTTIATGVTTTSYTDTAPSSARYYYVVSAVSGGTESNNSMEAYVNLPYPWLSQDVGSTGLAGSAKFDNGIFNVTGSGADIWGSSDAFRFAYLPATGNCTLIARVASVQNSDGWAKAGLMIRDNLNANSMNAFIAVTPGNGVTWQTRTSNGGNSNNSATGGIVAPYWVKLVRSGNTFTGYRSIDGVTWTQQGSATTINMASTAYVGLVVTSHNNSKLCEAVFDNVTVPGWVYTLLPTIPADLTATAGYGYIDLDWKASQNTTSYKVKRATTSGGTYTVIAENIITNSYRDNSTIAGQKYYYVVSAVGDGNESADSEEATPAIKHLYLKFDETTGTTAADATGNGRPGTLFNGPLWSTGKYKNAVDLDGTDDYISLPTGVVSTLTDFTISTWVYLDAASQWSRVFDFGSGTATNMFLTPTGGSSVVRFALKPNNTVGEQIINGTAALPTGVWTHVAVTLSGSTGILYVNGLEVGRNTAMTATPSAMGSTTQNYIGKSQYSDPYLNGKVDDFRIYSNALKAGEIADLAAKTSLNEAPYFINDPTICPTAVELKSYTSTYLTSAVADPENDTLSFSKVSGPAWLSVAANGTLSGLPNQSNVGSNSFIIKVQDAQGLYDTAVVTIPVADIYSGSQGMSDLEGLVANWLMSACTDTPSCGGADLNGDGKVDLSDFAILTGNWLADSLQFHLTLDETSGTNAADSSYYNNPGTLTNGPTWTTGKLGGALSFDGVDDYVVSEYQGIAGTNPRTVCAWVKADADPTNAQKNLYSVVSWGGNVTNGMAKWFVAIDDQTGQLAVGIYGSRIKGGMSLEDGQWHHVAAVLPDGATNINQIKLYVDGTEVDTNASTLNATINTAFSEVSIGSINNSTTPGIYNINHPFRGSIDDVRIYDRALSVSELAGLAQQ